MAGRRVVASPPPRPDAISATVLRARADRCVVQIVDKLCSFGYSREEALAKLQPNELNPVVATYYLLHEMYEREDVGEESTSVVRGPVRARAAVGRIAGR